MLKALIVDDVAKAIVVLRRQLAEHCPEVNVVAEAEDVDEAIKMIELHRPQLVFLDIEMSGKTGFDLLEECKERNFHVIFVTAHSEFAIKAFRFSVTDYLLKPVSGSVLKQAVKRVVKLSEASAEYVSNSSPQTLRIPSINGLAFVRFNDIIRLEADGHYTHIYLVNGKHYYSSYHLQQFEEHLKGEIFLRAHRSHIINCQKIKELHKKQGLVVEMMDGCLIEVPRRNKEEFLKILELRK